MCFALRVQGRMGERRRFWTTLRKLALSIAGLLLIPVVAIVVPIFVSNAWPAPDETMFIGLVKIGSLIALAAHTFVLAPKTFTKFNAIAMGSIAIFLIFYLVQKTSGCVDKTIICEFPKYPGMTATVNVVAFAHMFFFTIHNLYLLWEYRHEASHLGTRLFAQAFLFGVNIPSIVAFAVILALYNLNFAKEPELFLNGAIGLLIFASTAASVCVDRFAEIFIDHSDTGTVGIHGGAVTQCAVAPPQA